MIDSPTLNASRHEEIFAANRALGHVVLSVKAAAGGSRRERVHEAGSLRVRFPNGEGGRALDAVIVNTAGGIAGGDRFDIEVAVGGNAALTVTTAAAEKVYRSLGPEAEISVKLDVAAGGFLAWLPQETILFDRVRLRRTIDVTLRRDAKLVLLEAVVFGRSAMGETVRDGRLFDRWRVRVAGELVFAETIRLDGAIADHLAERAVARDSVAVASVLAIPGNEADVAAVRAEADNAAGEIGVSCWNGLVLARLVAPDGAALRRDLAGVATVLSGRALPRLWLN